MRPRRPGRFDRRMLDRRYRRQKSYTENTHKGKPLEDTADLESLAKQTVGFGATLPIWLRAAILAVRRQEIIGMAELGNPSTESLPERKSRKISPKEKEVTAYHGDALVARMSPNADRFIKSPS